MQMNDSQRIPASREQVWAALNDPAVLKQCIPGCQSLEVTAPRVILLAPDSAPTDRGRLTQSFYRPIGRNTVA